MSNNKLYQVLICITGAFMLWFILIMLSDATTALPGLNRIFQIFGGNTSGYIQAITYAAFFYGVWQLIEKQTFIRKQHEGFKLNLLPVEESTVLSLNEVANIKSNVTELEKRGFYFLVSDFIRKTCTQYRNNQNIGETLHVLEAQVETSKGEMEGQLEMVRYIIQAIASLGFIGTVIGLSASIGKGHLAKTDEGMAQVTNYLNLAFDTTIVALLLGLILTFFYHRYLEYMDTFYSRAKSYVVDNLISRIYHP